MKWMVASDIHGSAFFCEKLMTRFEEEQADRLLLLGDLLYHGPRNELPKDYECTRTIELLNNVKDKITAVRGNCDAEVDQMVLEFPMMADYVTLEIDGHHVYATHGHLHGEYNPPNLEAGDILLNGHTHVPKYTAYKNFIYMNPGSVSIPKQGSHHGYMTIEDGVFRWKNVETGETVLTKQL